MMAELGVPATVAGVAALYAGVAATLVIDPADAHLADDVEAAGMRALVTPSVMSVPGVAARLARQVLAAGGAR
jgi:LPPG:FO 2-phospho-L-lactate transferase